MMCADGSARMSWLGTAMLLLVLSLNAWHALAALAAVEGDGGSSGSHNSADTGAEWDLAWSVADGVSSPILRQAHSMVTAREHFLVVFGGFGDRSSSDFLSDSWVFRTSGSGLSPGWVQVAASGATRPDKRAFHSAVVHNASSTMLVFAGVSKPAASSYLQNYNDLWALDLSGSPASWQHEASWRSVEVSGTKPARRNEQVAVMVGDSMFIFGGVATGGANDITVFGDLWQYRFDVNQWREVVSPAAASPSARFSHAAALVTFSSSPQARRLRVPEQRSRGASQRNVHATLDPSSDLAAELDPAARASLLRGDGVGTVAGVSPHVTAPDVSVRTTDSGAVATSGRALVSGTPVVAFTVFGGRSIRQTGGATLVAMLSDTWMLRLASLSNSSDARMAHWLTGAAWERQNIPGYTFSRIYHSAVGVGDQFVVFGGFSRLDDGNGGQSVGYIFNDLLRVFLPTTQAVVSADAGVEGGKWQVATFASDAQLPPVRYDHAATMATVSDGRAMFLFGGRYDSLQPGLWSVPLADSSASVAWRPVTPADFTAGNTVTGLFTSPHFVIAMLSLMMLCFCVFVASFRRSSRRRRFEAALANLHHGGADGVGVGDPNRAPRGVPQPVIESLPQVRYVATAPTSAGDGSHAAVTPTPAKAKAAPGAGAGASKLRAANAPASAVAHPVTAGATNNGGVEADPLSQTTCAICLCEFDVGEMLTELPCRHRYHPACIGQWLNINKHCPLCKRDVLQQIQP